jgi:streptogramin lyase
VAGPDGNLWFTEGFVNKIGRITPAGVITEFPIPTETFYGPFSIAAGTDGALWFTEKNLGESKIGRITTAGVVTEFPIPNPTGYYAPANIAAGSDGNLWFTESFIQDPLPGVRYRIGRITTAGVITEFTLPTVDTYPQGITAGPDGNIWFTEYGKIGRLNLSATCALSPTSLCLNNGRFKAEATWTTSDGKSGAGQAVSLTPDAGYFWFFSSSNIELVVKALSGCSFNNHYWVFASGLTNVNVVLTVTDTLTGAVATYNNPQGIAFQPIQDTRAFACP